MSIAGNTMPSFHLAHEQVLSIEPENREGGINALNCGWGIENDL